MALSQRLYVAVVVAVVDTAIVVVVAVAVVVVAAEDFAASISAISASVISKRVPGGAGASTLPLGSIVLEYPAFVSIEESCKDYFTKANRLIMKCGILVVSLH